MRGSHIWQSLLIGIKLLLEGMSLIVGDGQTIWIWKDQWLPQGTLHNYFEGPLLFHDEDRRVSSLRTNHSWNFDSFDFPISPQLQNLI